MKRALIVLAAVLGYGGWAVYSNMLDQPAAMHSVAWRAGCIQGGYAGLLTLINISILESLYRVLLQRQGITAASITTLLVSTVAQYSIIIPVHLLNGTPNILLTLLPGLVIGTAFSSAYLWSLRRYARYTQREAAR